MTGVTIGFFGKLAIGFVAVLAILGIIGLVMKAYAKKKGVPVEDEGDEVIPMKEVENVLNLNDRFNRARYMEEDEAREKE